MLYSSYIVSLDIEYQSSLTICKLETVSNGSYNIKVIKQKMLIDNMEYLMHEAFGLENKSVPQDDKVIQINYV